MRICVLRDVHVEGDELRLTGKRGVATLATADPLPALAAILRALDGRSGPSALDHVWPALRRAGFVEEGTAGDVRRMPVVERFGAVVLMARGEVCRECRELWLTGWPAADGAPPSWMEGLVEAATGALRAAGTEAAWWLGATPGLRIRPYRPHPACCGSTGVPPGDGEVRRLCRALDPIAGPLLGVEAANGITVCDGEVALGDGGSRRVHGFGKGRCAREQVLSAVGEGIERAHWLTDRPDVRARARDLDAPVVPPPSLGLFTPEQYERNFVDHPPYSPEARLPWRRARALVAGTECWVLHSAACEGAGLFRDQTNGWAVHHAAEATVRAILEVVERDAALLAWWGARPGSRVVGLPREIGADVRRLGADPLVLDITSEIGLPVALALGRGRAGGGVLPTEGWAASTAAGLGAEEAVRAAVAGLAQTIAGVRATRAGPLRIGASPRAPHDHLRYYLQPAHGPLLARLVDEAPALEWSDWKAAAPPVAAGRLERIAARLARAGLDAVWTDVTQPFVSRAGVRVVRSHVPGLLSPFFGPARQARLGGWDARVARLGLSLPLPYDAPPHPFG